MIIQFLVALMIIVGLHELGHMLFAKWFGIKVEKYSIGFPPKLFSYHWKGTEYILGLIPLGGYVKIAGMVDESLDTKSLQNTKPQPWEFRAKPVWQRIIVMLGGIFFNFLTSIVLFIGLTYYVGTCYLDKDLVNQYGIVPSELGVELGFEEGDQIVNMNGETYKNFNDYLTPKNLFKDKAYYTIIRNGKLVNITLPSDAIHLVTEAYEKGKEGLFAPIMPVTIHQVEKKSPAELAGLQPGDEIMMLGDEPFYFHHMKQRRIGKYKNQIVPIEYKREGSLYTTEAKILAEGKLGVQCVPKAELLSQREYHSLIKSIWLGTKQTFGILKLNAIGLGKLITGKISPSKSLGGPLSIAKLFPKQFHVLTFINILASLSLILAFMNLLPIPALDGGHAMLLTYEVITGKQLPLKAKVFIQKIGITILLLLMGYALYNDISKFFLKR